MWMGFNMLKTFVFLVKPHTIDRLCDFRADFDGDFQIVSRIFEEL